MQFSLVVTCFNEMKSLPLWYEDVLGQTRRPDEIVIVDSESTDGTTEYLNDWAQREPRVRVIAQKCKPARGHNIGNEAAKFDHILSTDMGVRLCPVWCEELIKPFEVDPDVEIVAGNTQIDKNSVQTAAARAEYYIENGGEPTLGPGFVPGNRSVAYLKRVWHELGGLPEDLTFYADDSVFGQQMIQAGYKMAYAPKAMTYWGRPAKLRQFWKERFNYGRGNGEAAIKVPCAFRWYARGYLPKSLVPPVTAVRFLHQRCKPATLLRVLRGGGVSTLLMVPPLTLGQGYSFGKGFLIGDERGKTECRACRNRLSTETRAHAE